MRKILIVGGDSVLGRALSCKLNGAGDVRAIRTTRRKENLSGSALWLDLCEPETFSIPKGIDTAIVCAHFGGVSSAEENPDLTRNINVTNMIRLMDRFVHEGIRIVYFSTNLVYDGSAPSQGPSSGYAPLCEHGRQKLAVQEQVKSYGASGTVLQSTKIIHPDLPLAKAWIEQLSANKSVDAVEDMVLSPVWISQFIEIAAQLVLDKVSGEFSWSGKDQVTYYEMAKHLAVGLGKDPGRVRPIKAENVMSDPAFLPRFVTLDCSRLSRLLGREPQISSEVFDRLIGSLAASDSLARARNGEH